MLVGLGAIGVLALLGLAGWVGWNWHRIQTGLRVPASAGRSDLHIAGCDHAFLHEPTRLDAGRATRASHYLLYCAVDGGTAPLPTCDEVIARYVAASGPLPTSVRVMVWHGRKSCDATYAGDGTPE
ncbi:MAG: hypothetical protein ABSE49_19730 [Polyangiaceae bacterium]